MRILYLVSCLAILSNVTTGDDSFVETFDGNGPFKSPLGLRMGLDNPDWNFVGDGEMRAGGYSFVNAPNRDGSDSDRLYRLLFDDCSFVETVEILDAFQGPIPDFTYPSTVSWFSLLHGLNSAPEGSRLSILVHEADDNPSDWELIVAAGASRNLQMVPSGTHISLEISFDKDVSQATFAYDNNLDDDLPSITLGPFDAPGRSQETHFQAIAGGHGVVSGILDHWSYTSLCDEPSGDFNNNGVLDADDIDFLSDVARQGTNDPVYDLNSDQLVDQIDRTVWVESLRETYFGDANLDGEFNSGDLVAVFQAAEYEDEMDLNSGWASGDWNGDGDFTSRDLVLAFQAGGYESGPRVALVPEPSAWLLLGIAIMLSRCRMRRTV
jgi:hypothetical protein